MWGLYHSPGRCGRPPFCIHCWTRRQFSGSAVRPPDPEYVSNNDHGSGKWTSGAPVQHRTHSYTHWSICMCVCVCVMIMQSCVVKLMITETWLLARIPTGRPYGWELQSLPSRSPPHPHPSFPPLLPPSTYPSIPPRHSTPADLLVLFNESLGSPAPKWKFHLRHPPCVTLGFILSSWWRFRGTGRRMMHGTYKMGWDLNHSLAEKGLLH